MKIDVSELDQMNAVIADTLPPMLARFVRNMEEEKFSRWEALLLAAKLLECVFGGKNERPDKSP